MKEQLSVSVVTYKNDLKSLDKLFNCLQEAKLRLKIFIIDNSPHNTIEKICKREKFAYIFSSKNLGFGAGHNIAIRKIIGLSEYHLVINPNVSFEKGTLERIYEFMEAAPDIGLVMPKVISSGGSIEYLCKLLPEPHGMFLRGFFKKPVIIRPLFKKLNDIYELRFTGYNKLMEVPCLSGRFMFIRNEVFKKMGIFDERFFMYFEDFDLSRRLRKHFRAVYYPDVVICHENTEGRYDRFDILKYHTVSAIKYFNKWGWFFDRDRKRVNSMTLEKLDFLR